jgi:thiamine-monophosphate kinase
VVVGIGDDCAVIDTPGSDYLLATVDMLVQGVHFLRDALPEVVGRRSLAVNMSDIAAMGGRPTAALVSLALPSSTHEAWVDTLFRGIGAEAGQFGTAIAGGNLTRTDGPPCIDIAMLGTVPKAEVLLRRQAQVGDIVGVTGVLGAEAARRAVADETSGRAGVPTPRVTAGRQLASSRLVHAMMDISDGLAADLAHLAGASSVGAVVRADSVPVSVEARRAGERVGRDPLEFALFGGEDYELLFTVPEADWDRLVAAVEAVPLYQVGTILGEDQGLLLEQTGGAREVMAAGGWTHF